MPPIESSSLILAVGVAATAVLLVVWQLSERSRRPDAVGPEDAPFYAWQDVRRGCVAVIMTVVAAGVYFGSRIPSRVGGRPNLLYVETWVGILVLVVSLLVLALIDWTATHRYAARHRRAILDEGIRILRDGLLDRELARFVADDAEDPSSRPGPGEEPGS